MHHHRWSRHGDPLAGGPFKIYYAPGCSVAGCDRPGRYIRGWCPMHYGRWCRHGDPLHESVIMGDDRRRFWSKVDKRGPLPTNMPDLGPCWLWTAGLSDRGYGVICMGGRGVGSHKWAWEQEHGPVPDGLELDHLCRVRRCVRPTHLEPVTHTENMARGAHARKTHCPRGHPYDEANTLLSDGRRNCKACRADWQRAYRARLRALRCG